MRHPLDGCAAKLTRAEEHAHSLRAAIEQVATIPAVVDVDPDTRGFRYTQLAPLTVPIMLPIILGDAIHNLRSALDHLVWGITTLDGGTTGKWTGFPILMDPPPFRSKKWWKSDSGRTLAGLGPRRRRIVVRVQPYQRGDRRAAASDPLAVLHDLDINDKHKEPNLIVAKAVVVGMSARAIRDCEVEGVTANVGVMLDIGAHAGEVRYRVSGPEPQVEVKTQVTPKVEFPDGTPIAEKLRQLRDYVYGRVVWPLAPTVNLSYPAFVHSDVDEAGYIERLAEIDPKWDDKPLDSAWFAGGLAG
jgi:hypothetical protein